MGVIRLKNMQFFAYHGVYDFEKELGAPFEVDVEINTSFSQAIKSDDIQETINYDSIFKLVDSIISKKKYNLINKSLNETLSRTIITSLTTLFVVVILYIWGGDVLKPFSLALIIGVVIGTYSSLFIASPIMFLLDKKYNIDIEKE